MKKLLLALALTLALVTANAAPGPITRPLTASIFSTSSDWEAVTGLRLSPHDVSFTSGRWIGNTGWEVYFLDAFPCYGQSEFVRTWIAPSRITGIDRDARMSITCLFRPKTIKLAQRIAESRAVQARTMNLLECPVSVGGRGWLVDLENCETTSWDKTGN